MRELSTPWVAMLRVLALQLALLSGSQTVNSVRRRLEKSILCDLLAPLSDNLRSA